MPKRILNIKKELDGTDLMPFGAHKGTPMQDVPTSYLHWFYHKPDNRKDGQVYLYIKKNKAALRAENTDLIWD